MTAPDPVVQRQRHTIRPGLALTAALVVVAAVYSRSVDAPFVWDDIPLIRNEPAAHDPRPTAHLLDTFWRASPGDAATPTYYRPLTTWTYAIDWVRGGGAPGAFHVTNLALHLVACALVFMLALRLGASPLASGCASALFGTFPRLTECVSWISGRTDVLALLFAIGGFLVHCRRQVSLVQRIAAAVLVLLGLLSKEVAIAGAAAICVEELTRSATGPLRRRAVRLVPLAITLAAYGGLRWNALHAIPVPPPTEPRTVSHVATWAAEAVGRYVLMLVDPLRPRLQVGLLDAPDARVAVLGAAVLLALGSWAAWHAAGLRRLVERDGSVAAVACMGLVAIALVLHIVPIRVNVVAADRFLYVPIAALAVLGAVAASRMRRRATAVGVLVALPAFSLATFARADEWRDEITLWERAVATTPALNTLPEYELGNALRRAHRMEEALVRFQAVARRGDEGARYSAQASAAITLADLGRLDEAAFAMRMLLAGGRETAQERYNLGVVEAKRLQFDRALAEFDRALVLFPGYEDVLRARRITVAAREDWDALPPERTTEATPLIARRARILTRLGNDRRASELWHRVSDLPDATASDFLEAARFFVNSGDETAARTLIPKLEQVGLHAEADVLRGLLDEGERSRS